jgi:hypothetical protein
MKKTIWMLIINFALILPGCSNGREKIELTGAGWKAWMDKEAAWQNDKLYLPGEITNIDDLPHNMPTGGWSVLDEAGMDCFIPATIEELFSGGVNRWTYYGVSWFWKDVQIPAGWQGKTVRIKFADTRMRAEVYVNADLAGYDLVAETPWETDITGYLKYDSVNRIAIRLTNPGGDRGWQDFPFIDWGEYQFPHSHDFTGIGGPVSLVATDDVYIDNIFVKNELPALANNISVNVDIKNKGATENLTMEVDILPASGGASIYNNSWDITANADAVTTISKSMTVPDASLWNIDDPNLYQCVVSISGGDNADSESQTFGFRVFEARENDNLYFNNKRIRYRSAIDWGFYAISGYYATHEMARKSVQNAKAIGHNQINFHRTIGEPLVMKYADELGLYLYEEPGAFHAGEQYYEVFDSTFAGDIMYEKVRRMVIRDRNHPSLVQINLCNEDNGWNTLRERAMKMVNKLDNSVIVTNTSAWSDTTNHIRPYESTIRSDLADWHTVEAEDRFQESDLKSHSTSDYDNLRHWGEVRCYTGPPNWYNVAKLRSLSGTPGYDENIYKPLHDDILDYFTRNNLPTNGSKVISSPSEVSTQAGRGLMYIDGRLGQVIMLSDAVDGYAINGWSAGPQAAEVIPEEDFNWESAITDEARNLKGVASDFAYWVRDLQIAIIRQNGKYFKAGDKGAFDIHLINEGRLPAGSYNLSISVIDGVGNETTFQHDVSVDVKGGDIYAQQLIDSLLVPLDASYHAGHITIEGKLYDGSTVVADGAEQVLLQNRSSWNEDIAPYNIAVSSWAAAKTAIQDAGVTVVDFSTGSDKLDFICAAGMPDASLSNMLNRVKNDGTTLIIKFTQEWADALLNAGLLSKNVTRWISGDTQTPWWNGNGWGYLDYYIGDQAVPSKSTIGTNSWEVPDDPQGFYPFESSYLQTAYGAHFARPDKFQYSPDLPDDRHSTSVLIGAIQYGKGKVILDASYWVDDNHALNDMLFYNFIKHGSAEITKTLSTQNR